MADIGLVPTSPAVTQRSIACTIGSPTSTGQPANAATQLFIGPPAGKLWRVRSLRSIYTCDATQGDRVLAAAYTSAVLGDTWSMMAGTVALASHLIEVSGGDGGSPGQVNVAPAQGAEGLFQIVNIGWPSVWISSDVTLRVWMLISPGAGDTFSSAQAYIEEKSA